MLKITAPHSEKLRKSLWGCSLFLWFGGASFLGSGQLALAYGSFLLWAVSAGYVWGRKAPFLTVGFFLTASASLQWAILVTDPLRWLTREVGLWVLVQGLISWCSYLAWRVQQQALRIRKLEQGFLHEARLATLGRMTVSICHEMKNQIAVVLGYLDQMREDGGTVDTHERKIERSLLANNKMLKILTQLRSMSRDTLHEPLLPIALHQTLQEALDFLDRPLQYRAITVDLQLDAHMPPVMGDAVLLQTVFIHLLQQSLDHFHKQTLAEAPVKRIRIETRVEDGLVWIYYHDNSLRPKPLTEAEIMVLQQLVQRQGGAVQLQPHQAPGWQVILSLKAAPTAISSKTQEALAAS